MTSVAPAAAPQPPIFYAEAARTPLQEAVASELGGELASAFLVLPSQLDGFAQVGEPREERLVVNFGTAKKRSPTAVTVRTVPGELVTADAAPAVCPCCGGEMEGNGTAAITLWHLPMGMGRTRLEVSRQRWACRSCSHTHIEGLPFKAAGHRVTVPLLNFVLDLLELGQTLKAVSLMTGLHRDVVKAIDKARLESLYTEVGGDGKRRLRRPESQARYLGIDEFKLHDGHRYATVIIDLETGHVLWLAHTKRKQVVYDFCDFVGEEWMSCVVAVACDMNADFELLSSITVSPSAKYDRRLQRYVEWLLEELPLAGDLGDPAVADRYLPWSDAVPASVRIPGVEVASLREAQEEPIADVDPGVRREDE